MLERKTTALLLQIYYILLEWAEVLESFVNSCQLISKSQEEKPNPLLF